ncbi:MAG TPA: hypothetical protein VGJ86_01475 [Acidimicrobiales bacterium]
MTALAGLVAVVLLGMSSCGLLNSGGDDDGAATDGAPLGQIGFPDVKVDTGCGATGSTDEADLAADRKVARCAPDAPTALPLAQPVTLKVGVRGRTEDLAPILLADHFEQFKAENLTVEITEYDSAAELYDALETGAVDVVAGDLDGPFFDAVFRTGTGAGPRVVLGGPIAAHAQDTKTPQTGLWLRTDLLDEPDNFIDLEDIKQPVAVQDSIADVVTYPIDFVLQQDDISLNEVQTSTTSGEEAAKMLLSEELSGAWLTDPWWREVVDSDLQIELVATLPVSESLGGVVFAPRLLDPQRDRIAGLAFARAVVRTINTYLGQDYQEDDDVVDALVEVTGETKDDIVHTPAWVFDWELRLDTTSRIQEGMILLGGVVYEDDLPEPRLVDRTIYKEVVAQADQ